MLALSLMALLGTAASQTYTYAWFRRARDCVSVDDACSFQPTTYVIDECFRSTDDDGNAVFAKMIHTTDTAVMITFYPFSDTTCAVPRSGPNNWVYELDTCTTRWCLADGWGCSEMVARDQPYCPTMSTASIWVAVVLSTIACFCIVGCVVSCQRRKRLDNMRNHNYQPVQPRPATVVVGRPTQPTVHVVPVYQNAPTQGYAPAQAYQQQAYQPYAPAQQAYQPPPQYQQQAPQFAPVQKPQ